MAGGVVDGCMVAGGANGWLVAGAGTALVATRLFGTCRTPNASASRITTTAAPPIQAQLRLPGLPPGSKPTLPVGLLGSRYNGSRKSDMIVLLAVIRLTTCRKSGGSRRPPLGLMAAMP